MHKSPALIFFYKNHINHEEKGENSKYKVFMMVNTKNNKDMKSNLRGNSKGSKKLQSRRTI